MKIKTRYLVIAAAAILAVSAFASIRMLTHTHGGSFATVYVDGEAVRTLSLDEPGEFEIETKYGTNTVCVRDGGVCVSDADCPDKLCVRMGLRSDDLVPIACLPHHLIIKIDGANITDGVDAVAGVAP